MALLSDLGVSRPAALRALLSVCDPQVNISLGTHPSQHNPHPSHPRSQGSVQGAANPDRLDRSDLEPAYPTSGVISPQARLPRNTARRAEMSRPLWVCLTLLASHPFGSGFFEFELDQILLYLTKCTLGPTQGRQEMKGRKRASSQGRKVSPRLGSY